MTLPGDLIDAIEAEVGVNGRNEFIQEAVEEKLSELPAWDERRRQGLRAAVREMDGSLADYDIPGWETPDAAARWVRALRDGEPV